MVYDKVGCSFELNATWTVLAGESGTVAALCKVYSSWWLGGGCRWKGGCGWAFGVGWVAKTAGKNSVCLDWKQ